MPVNPGNIALFCDLAGTLVWLNEKRELPADSAGKPVIELLPGVAEKLKPMKNSLIFVVTNQSPIARGIFTADQIEEALQTLDAKLNGVLTGWRVCPHKKEDGCSCRKPSPEMVLDLAQMFGVELPVSTFVGDQEMDRECAVAAGVGKFEFAQEFFGFKENVKGGWR